MEPRSAPRGLVYIQTGADDSGTDDPGRFVEFRQFALAVATDRNAAEVQHRERRAGAFKHAIDNGSGPVPPRTSLRRHNANGTDFGSVDQRLGTDASKPDSGFCRSQKPAPERLRGIRPFLDPTLARNSPCASIVRA